MIDRIEHVMIDRIEHVMIGPTFDAHRLGAANEVDLAYDLVRGDWVRGEDGM
jgi:hypothetical protein